MTGKTRNPALLLCAFWLVTIAGLNQANASSLSIADVKAEAELASFSSEFQTTLALAFSGAKLAEEPLSVLEQLKLGPILDACHDNRCQQDLKAVLKTQWLVYPSLVSQGDRIVVSVNVWSLQGEGSFKNHAVTIDSVPQSRRSAFVQVAQYVVDLVQGKSSQPVQQAAAAKPIKRQRLVLMIRETTDGQPQSVQIAEGQITQALIQDGHRLVAGKIAQQLKTSQSFALAMNGQIPPELSGLDADFLVVGHADSAYFNELKKVQLVAFRSNMELKLIRLDTGEITASVQVEGKGNGFSKSKAARKALADAAARIVPQMRDALAQASSDQKNVELVVHEIPNFRRGSDLQASLEELVGADNVRVLHQANRLSKFEVTTPKGSRAFARTVDSKDLMPLEIVQVTPTQILARYSPARAVQLSTVIMAPIVKLGKGMEWLSDTLPDLLESELSNFEFLDIQTIDGRRPGFGRGKIRGADIVKSSQKYASAPLVVATQMYRASKKSGAPAIVDIKIYHGPTGALILGTTASAPLSEVASAVSTASEKLAKGFLPKILRNKSLKKILPPARDFTPKKQDLVPAKLNIQAIQLEPLYPAQMLRYQKFSSGTLKLKHDSPKGPAAKNVRVSIWIPSLMQMPVEIALADVVGGEGLEAALPLILDPQKLVAQEASAATQARVELTYEIDGGTQTQARTVPVMVHSARTVDWSDGRAAAAFVTPRESSVRGLAEQVADGVVDDASAYRHAVASFEALKQLGFRYVKDPNGVAGKDSLDEIQFPRETLESRVGDCDDLTVLYAATLEAMGIETAFVYVPGHILLAFDSQYAPGASHRLGKAAFEHGGKLWVPIEATAIPDGFLAARARGMKEVNRWKKAGKLTLQPVHEAWQTHPPMALPKGKVVAAVDKTALTGSAAKVMKALEAERSQSMAAVIKQAARKAKGKRASLESVHAYGLALVRAENYPAAKDVFARAKAKAPGDHVVAINSMSLALLRGESIDLKAYAEAVEVLDEAALYNNLGLAYFHSGDVEQAGKAFLAAAQGGNTRLAESLGLMASQRRAAGGKGEASVLERDLQSVMMKAFNRAKKNRSKIKSKSRSRFTQALRTAGKRGTPPDVQRKLVDLLVWPSL
ncbi:MAG: hypothetical protein HOK28_18300 [Deltaproteobacteria bacterium]|nr:hypothetical protein [Deltaproteobacteria bacterium]